jgi:hypothetical protein
MFRKLTVRVVGSLFKSTVWRMAYLCELYKCRDKNYLHAMAFISCSVSVRTGTQFILEIHYIAGLCYVTFALHFIVAVCIDLLVGLSP